MSGTTEPGDGSGVVEPTERLPKIAIDGNRLTIGIGVDVLIFALLHGPYADRLCLNDDGQYADRLKITDKAAFLTEFIRELEEEAEDGTTLVHRMLDAAFERAVENGAEGIDYD